MRKWIYIDGGAGTPMLRFDGNLRKLDYLKKDIGFFPYLWGETDEVLIIGPGGGIDVLFALIGGSNKVIGVEVNPGIVRVMHKFSKFNGGIYEDYDNVQIVVDEGRRFMRASNDKFDLLYLSLVYTQSAELKGYSFTENYVFTREAFGEYLAHLKPNGRLVIIFHDIYDLTKGFITALKALQESGVKNIQEASSHIIVINGSRNDTIFRPLLVVKKSPFTSQEIKKISKLALKLEFTPLFLPYWKRGEFYAIISKGEESLQGFISYTSARVAPATDNSPFFYQFDKGVPLELKVLLYPISFLLLSMIFWIVIWERKRIKENTRLGTFLAVYFSVLGIGYMLIEVSLIEKSLLFLGYPSLLLSVVLFSLLLSSGLGSLLSERLIGKEISKKIVLVPLGISVIIIFYIPLLSFLFDHFLTMSILLRSLIVMGVVFPVGFLMGIPFPVGLQILRRYSPQHIPIAYAVNGVASVVGSIVVLVIALLFGFTQALLLSAGVYLIAWLPLLYIVPDLSLS
ncbi:hypothetical protein DRJ04_05090 [Candidatus Aerophobetes bacterium]|uniref:Methyltransferase domain-containing protein n=1 Tax=Aerophobetes bacterium TaxID=2030807 RepID=A0A662DFT9_UNCAE|nr:MAG: hypothetical protein DRJ04_05090 [Candidatus Aerophobetes bacterium]